MNPIIELLKQENRALSLIELVEKLDNLSAAEVAEEVAALEKQGAVLLSKKGKYALPELLGMVKSRIFMLRTGVPIAKPLDGSEEMRVMRRGDLRGMHGDIVLVRPEKNYRHGETLKCEIVAVQERAHTTLSGVLTEKQVVEQQEPYFVRKGHRRKRVVPPPVVRTELTITPYDVHTVCRIELTGDLMGCRVGDAVEAAILDYPRHQVPLKARILKKLGDGKDVRVQLRALLAGHGIREQFPEEVMQQAQALPQQVRPEDLQDRLDARNLLLFTIDGADAQDFDDAVSLEKNQDGDWVLGVHIADVSHYVRPRDEIDREALRRGTSVYLPGLTVPMLPEALCNHLCSLMPDVDRLAFSIFLHIRSGQVIHHELTPSVIHSSARLTYEQVNRLFAGEENNVPQPLHGVLSDMLALSGQLRAHREGRGAIDFELAEPHFTLNEEGMPTDVSARERGLSERMIEDFMLCANERVAEVARQANLPFLYRVHENPDPDRIHALETFLANINHPVYLGEKVEPRVLRQLLEDTRELPESDVIRHVMLRSLKKACYSENPLGHYGLAAKDYCHFTSPIRRYPDLTVHRMLKRLLSGQKDMERLKKSMHELASQCSQTEQEAVAVERDADDLMCAYYMQGREGEEFSGVVSGVTGWGYYVTLPNTIEGMVHVRTMDGYFEYDEDRQLLIREDRRRIIRLGDQVKVRLIRADVMAGEIDFEECAGRR